MDEDHEALGDDPAAAFEALRSEVAALRASLGDGDGRVAPDYAPTLGKMAACAAGSTASAMAATVFWSGTPSATRP